MATLVLSAAGAALGGTFSGSVLGLSGAVIGRAVGATIGRVIDQKLLGQGSDPVETGKIDRYRLAGVGEGTPVTLTHGRMRLGGQVIWSTHFLESSQTTGGGGKGAPSQPETTTFSYSVSVALALCEGEILSLGRVWADGTLVDRATLNMTVYHGREDQLPDPKMEAVEGVGAVPAYRGTAYVVVEDLDLSPYGNRLPQLSFEVVRAPDKTKDVPPAAGDSLRGVAMIPGTGEYALATTPVSFQRSLGNSSWINMNAPSGETDFLTSLNALDAELPNCDAVSLVVCWFGDDLRAGHCTVRPKVEQRLEDGNEMPWSVSGLSRSSAEEIPKVDDRPIYGGTPADAAVVEAIAALNSHGKEVMIYPFLLMEILAGNGLPDPWSESENQPALPWRGRISGDKALGVPGSSDGTAANTAAADAFFGTVTASNFAISAGAVSYSGPDEWSYSRFVLHLAALAAAAGGVTAFCVASELRGLTQMRDELGFPAVDKLIALAAEVRAILPDAKIGYAADWSEYFGYHPQDGSGDVLYHLDPLWADANVDFVGIDNYMPLADWRDGSEHLDATWGSIYNIDYLKSNIEGGEGYDWYYPSPDARNAQIRTPITDGAGGTPWIYRYKDIRNWWSNLHVERRHPADLSVLENGAQPRDWTPVGAATTSVSSDSFDRYVLPVEVAAGSANTDGVRTQSGHALVAEQSYELRVHFRLGSSDACRVVITHGANSTLFELASSLDVQISGDDEPILDHEVITGEVITLRVVLRYQGSGVADVSVGPNSATPGSNILIFGADLLAWPVPPTAWVPQSKPIWFTEIGCPAIDKGANQPNVFFDPKSSESAVPYFSSARRDDTIQLQALRAVTQYWSDPQNNPVSPHYDGQMVDTNRVFAWAWDSRPYPAFPNSDQLWSDGENFAKGHWLSGRISGPSLDLVVAEICRRAGVTDIDVSQLHGVVRGHSTTEVDTARAQLQPLMLAYNFTATEREGKIVFEHVPLLPDAVITDGEAVVDDQNDGLSFTRASEAETVGRVRLTHVEADGAFETALAEAMFPDEAQIAVSQNELPLSLTGAEARDIAERWLATSRLARDTVTFSLPPSRRDVQAGSLVELPGGTLWRVDRMEDLNTRKIEATRVEPSVSVPPASTEITVPSVVYSPPTPVEPVFLDLPLLRGDEVEHAPHLAVAATPWPGRVAVYSAPSDSNFTLNTLVDGPSTIGSLETPLAAADANRWDRGAPVRIRVSSGNLSSVTRSEVLNGANVAAIGADDTGPWEVIQFADATLVGPEVWELSMRLRGQAGTEAFIPSVWPAGTKFVLLDGRPAQIELATSARGLSRFYRIGPSQRSYDDSSYVVRELSFDGAGLRPYAPAHLRYKDEGAALAFSWIRRTRIDGDSWQGTDVPLGEDAEAYLVRVGDAGGIRREVVIDTPSWTYDAADRISDGTAPDFTVYVAQISARFGPGPSTRITINV